MKASRLLFATTAFTAGAGPSVNRRAGGGARGGHRGVGLELLSGGGVGYSAIGQVSCKPLKAYPNSYMDRPDYQFNLRTPSRGSAMSKFYSFNIPFQNNGWWMLQQMGLRTSNARSELREHNPGSLVQRYQLIKVCPKCYYWTDGVYDYNLCTKHNKSHWHRKATPLDPAEGYRPLGRMGGIRHTRKAAFTLPVHRLGSPFPKMGTRKIHYGNPTWSNFDKWITLRRFHHVGAPAINKRYKFIPLSFPEL